MESSHKTPICVFVKPPTPGEVKTRLAPAVGIRGAAMLAQSFFEDTWESLRALGWARPIVAATREGDFGSDCEVWLQGEGDLGRKLENILQRALRDAPAAIALGADLPGLPTRFLESARKAFRSSDAVLGPSEDGGFYLLGLKNCPHGLLSGIGWSHSDTFGQTIRRLRQARMEVTVLETWFDIDTPDDLARLRSLIKAGAVFAPHTAGIFARLGTSSHMSATQVDCARVGKAHGNRGGG